MYNKNKTLFLNKNSNYNYDENINIILSPELYWVRTFDIPIKNKKDVLKVVPSFFEDFLDVENYKFYVLKQEDDKYLCFAYDESLITDMIKKSNLTINQVSNIYFAQNECINVESFKVQDMYYVYKDGVLLNIPKEFVNSIDMKSFNFDNVQLSKYKISINTINKYIDNKNLYIFSTLFLIVAFLNFGKIGIITNNTDEILEKQRDVKKEYKLLSTMIQTKAVIKTLERKEDNQIKLRDKLKDTFNLSGRGISRVYLQNSKVSYE